MASLSAEARSRIQELIVGIEQILAREYPEDLEISHHVADLKELIILVDWGECPLCENPGGQCSCSVAELNDDEIVVNHDSDETLDPEISHIGMSSAPAENTIPRYAPSLPSSNIRKKTRITKLPCPHCEKKFEFPSRLEVHVYSHEKLHQCPVKNCGQPFGQSKLVKTHIRREAQKDRKHWNVAKERGIEVKIFRCPNPNCAYWSVWSGRVDKHQTTGACPVFNWKFCPTDNPE